MEDKWRVVREYCCTYLWYVFLCVYRAAILVDLEAVNRHGTG